MTVPEFARFFDHTMLKPDATAADVLQLCNEARQWGFAAACVAPSWVPLVADMLRGTKVAVASVAGFPHGNTLSRVKALETSAAIDLGATEVDMVLPIGLVKGGAWRQVEADIRAVVEASRSNSDVIIKVIFETAFLTDAEKQKCCLVAEAAGAHFVKTSTGFASAGATVEDIRLMRGVVGQRLGVKAAGGIRDLATAQALIEAGANRLGSSSCVKIVQDFAAQMAAPHS